MNSVDVELEEQLKEAGEQLLHPSDSVDELLAVLDQLEKLLLKVYQSPQKSMLEALKPSMKGLIQDSLLKHSDEDVKVSVASCISEITRITAPDAPYNDDQMRDVFQLIVSSFEDLADRSSRSYNKRASILDTVSKVRSCVIMLDLECDGLIVDMFKHFLRSVRDYHFESIYPSMETIMVLILEESEEITAEMLRPLLASVKKDHEGVLPVARKLGEGVLLKSANKLKPCLMQILTSLGESLDMYTKVVASICEGTTVTFENNDENASGLQLANESKMENGSVDEAHQADESKLKTSSDHTEQVVKEGDCTEEIDPTVNRSSKSVMSNGVNVVAKEEASVDQESSKKLEEDINEKHLNKEDTDDSDADKLVKAESQKEKTSKKRGKNSAVPSDSSHVEGDKEIEKDIDVKEPENEEDNEMKESENEEDNEIKETENEEDNAVKESENEEDNDVKESENEEDNEVKSDNEEDNAVKELENEEDNSVKESENEEDNEVKESDNEEDNDAKELENEEKDNDVKESENEAFISSPKAKENKPATANISSPSQSNKKKQVPQKDENASPSKSRTPSDETRAKKAGKPKSKGSTKKRGGKNSVVVQEVKPPPKDESEDDGEATNDSDAKPVRKSTKQSGKKVATGDSEAKKPKQSDVMKSKQSGKKAEKKEESDSDAKPLKLSVKKGEKSKITDEEEEESDSENKPLKLSAKKSNSKKKDDVKKRGNGKNVTQKDQAKSLSSDHEMEIDSSPKSATKSGEGNSKETPVTSAKRKRSTSKDKVSIKYDESLIGTKVKVWWPEDKMYYEGVVDAFYSDKKKHKVLYVDGEVETLNLKTQKWEILEQFSLDEEPTIEAQSDKASPQIHKKKRTKTETASQEKIKDSAKRSKISASKDKKSKENPKKTEKSKEDEETPRSKTTSKSNGKTPQTSGKGKSGSSSEKEPEAEKTSESTKSGKKRKKRN